VSLRALMTASALAVWIAAPAWAARPGDVARGEQVYARCQACHALASDRVGPHHCGLFGRLAGSVPGFAYSPAMKKSRIVWNEKTLDSFLAKPLAMVPGTAMTYDGVPDPQERADLIAYLKHANDTPECAARSSAGH
jgi:cytochrome c